MLSRITNFIILTFTFLIPLFFLPLTPEAYEYPKMFLLMVVTVLLFVAWITKCILHHRITIRMNTFSIPLILLAHLVLISALLQSPNIVSSLTLPMATGTLIAGILFFFLTTQEFNDDYRGTIGVLFTLSSIIITLYTILLYIGVLPRDVATPAGNLLGTALVLGTCLVFTVTKLIHLLIAHNAINLDFLDDDEEEGNTKKTVIREEAQPIPKKPVFFWSISTLILGIGTGLLAIHLFSDQQPILLPFSIGWSILMEVLKNVKSLALGMGPGNFITAFSLGKPVVFNATPYFNLTFTSSSSFLLTLATEVGLVAAFLFILVIIKLISWITKSSRRNSHEDPSFAIAALFALMTQIILPSYVALFCLLMLFLGLIKPRRTLIDIDLKKLGFIRHIFLLFPIIILSLALYFGGRAYWGEMFLKKSLDAYTAGQGTQAYTSGVLAIAANPYQERYHMILSQVSMAVANSLAGQKDLTEDDKQKIPKLTQAAIEEARNAVILNKTSVTTWDNLARIYGGLLGYAQGSDTWTIDTYKQRIALDPYNPTARISLGGVFLTLKRYSEAESAFREAVSLKPDYANGYFNLGVALREQKNYPQAYASFQKSLSLLPTESEDAKKVTEELATIPTDATQSATPKPTEEPKKPSQKEATKTPEPLSTLTPKSK
jgi:tetratricopeptide (TPR) repeat protein